MNDLQHLIMPDLFFDGWQTVVRNRQFLELDEILHVLEFRYLVKIKIKDFQVD